MVSGPRRESLLIYDAAAHGLHGTHLGTKYQIIQEPSSGLADNDALVFFTPGLHSWTISCWKVRLRGHGCRNSERTAGKSRCPGYLIKDVKGLGASSGWAIRQQQQQPTRQVLNSDLN